MTGRNALSSRIARWRSLSYYDFVLLALPLALLAGVAASVVLSVSPRTALASASGVAALMVGDAVFRNPPLSGQSA